MNDWLTNLKKVNNTEHKYRLSSTHRNIYLIFARA